MTRAMPLIRRGSVVLGPMAGITDAPFRAICKRMGADLTYTEMISAAALRYRPDSRMSRALLALDPDEVPCVVQIFGHDPTVLAGQAEAIVASHGSDVRWIDINMGCPVRKVVSKGAGAALMRTPRLAAAIVSEVAAIGIPVSVKIRSGWSRTEVNAVEFALAMEAAGASLVAIHARTRSQFFSGKADWGVIAEVKRSVRIPVIGSGDVFSARDVVELFEYTGVDGVMIARGARGNPWIFQQSQALMASGAEIRGPGPVERIECALAHHAALRATGVERAHVRMRPHVGWYLSGLPHATRVRTLVNRCESSDELVHVLRGYGALLAHLDLSDRD